MKNIHARPGFDWTTVDWAGPAEAPRKICSFCDMPFEKGEIPLTLCRSNGDHAAFCRLCTEDIFA